MTRSQNKGFYVAEAVYRKVLKWTKETGAIKIYSRASTIWPACVGIPFLIHNGTKFIPCTPTGDMVGHKFGEFSPTRKYTKRVFDKSNKGPVKAKKPGQK